VYPDLEMSGTMLAASSAAAALIDIGSLKSDVSACKTSFNTTGATCATFGADGDLFIGSSSGVISRFDRKGTPVGIVYSGSEPVVALAVKDTRTLVVAFANSVHIVNTTNSKITVAPISVSNTWCAIMLRPAATILSNRPLVPSSPFAFPANRFPSRQKVVFAFIICLTIRLSRLISVPSPQHWV
jgi:hypothetical protein